MALQSRVGAAPGRLAAQQRAMAPVLVRWGSSSSSSARQQQQRQQHPNSSSRRVVAARSRGPAAAVVLAYAGAGVPAGVVQERPVSSLVEAAGQQQQQELLLSPLPTQTENAADDPSLHNPLARSERLSTGWFGVIAEFDGVLAESTHDAHARAWLAVAEEMALPRPLGQVLQRIKGVRDEVIIMQLFHWTRNPQQVAKIAARKEEVYDALMNGVQAAEVPGSRAFLDTLRNYNIPVALATAQPERRVRPAIERLNLANYFDAVVTAEDNGAAELEFSYIAAATQLQRPFVRCVVVGDSNRSVEAAHELGMRSVVVTGGQPAWNFSGADLVVRNLSALSFVNMKKLFSNEDLVEATLDESAASGGNGGGSGDDGGDSYNNRAGGSGSRDGDGEPLGVGFQW